MASRGVMLTQSGKTRSTESVPIRCRILHVNDINAEHAILTGLFKPDRSFSIERARSGPEALQQLRQKAELPNFVIVSSSFARIACTEFIDQMKSDKRFAVIPIIVIASTMSSDEVMQAYDAGAACVLQTGPDAESLLRSFQAVKHFWTLVMLPFRD